jgi:hypothetical protein
VRKYDRVQAAVRRMAAVEAQMRMVDRRSLRYREVVDPHPWVLPEVLRLVEASFETEEQEWELDQLEAIRVRVAASSSPWLSSSLSLLRCTSARLCSWLQLSAFACAIPTELLTSLSHRLSIVSRGQEEEEQRFDADQELLDLWNAAGSAKVEGGVEGGVAAAASLYSAALRSLMHQQRFRALVGDDWEQRVDPATSMVYFYNIDTRQMTWDRPLSVWVRACACAHLPCVATSRACVVLVPARL